MALSNKNGELFKLLQHIDGGWQTWARWDEGAEVWEIFASDTGGDYIGCADTIEEAKDAARDYFEELMS